MPRAPVPGFPLTGRGVIFRGVSFTYPAAPGGQRTLWVMVGDRGNTLIQNEEKDGTIVSAGHGFDGFGAFEERSVMTFPAEDRYRFEMDRRYARIDRWLDPFNIIEAQRLDAQPPALPTGPASALRGLTGLLPEGAAGAKLDLGLFIPDGHAHVRLSRPGASGQEGVTWLSYSVPVSGDELLTYDWSVGGDDLRSATRARKP